MRLLQNWFIGGVLCEYASAYHYNGLNVIVSDEIKSDGLEWLDMFEKNEEMQRCQIL